MKRSEWATAAAKAAAAHERRGVWLIVEKPIAAIAAKRASSARRMKNTVSIFKQPLNQNHSIPSNLMPRHNPAERQAVSTHASANRLNAQR